MVTQKVSPRNDPAGTCRERYVSAEDLEAHVEQLYTSIPLAGSWAERLPEELDAEVMECQRADVAQRELLTLRIAKAETERSKLLDAYYGGAIDVPTFKGEQARVGADLATAKDWLADLDANLSEWQEILELAATFATRRGRRLPEGQCPNPSAVQRGGVHAPRRQRRVALP